MPCVSSRGSPRATRPGAITPRRSAAGRAGSERQWRPARAPSGRRTRTGLGLDGQAGLRQARQRQRSAGELAPVVDPGQDPLQVVPAAFARPSRPLQAVAEAVDRAERRASAVREKGACGCDEPCASGRCPGAKKALTCSSGGAKPRLRLPAAQLAGPGHSPLSGSAGPGAPGGPLASPRATGPASRAGGASRALARAAAPAPQPPGCESGASVAGESGTCRMKLMSKRVRLYGWARTLRLGQAREFS